MTPVEVGHLPKKIKIIQKAVKIVKKKVPFKIVFFYPF